jgi:tetratricopeptide (TPR) repeat protein
MDSTCNLGVLLARSGSPQAAIVLLEEAALIDPDRSEALEFLAAVHEQQAQWTAAIRTLEEALTRRPDSPRIHTALAWPLLQTGQAEAARKSLLQALESDENYAPALFNLSLLYGNVLSDPERAAEMARRFLQKNRKGARATELRTRMERWAGSRPSTAPTPPAEARPSSPPPPAAGPAASPLDLARSEAAEGRTAEALEFCLREAEDARLAGDPARREKALRTALQFAFDQAEAHGAYGMFLEERKDWPGAVRSYQKALLLEPESAEAARSLARVAGAAQNYDLALHTLQTATEDHPDNADLRFQLARLQDEFLRNPKEAAAQYRLFLSAFPNDPRAGAVRQKLHLPTSVQPARPGPRPAPRDITAAWTEAAPVQDPVAPRPPARNRKLEWQKAARRNPQAARQAIQRGIEHRQRGDLERAEYYFTRALENDEREVAAFQYLAEIHNQRGDLDLALDAYQRGIEFGRDSAGNRFNLATVYYARKESGAALAELRRALEMEPQFSPALYLCGLILSELPGRQAEARAYFSRFLAAAPENDPLVGPVRDWLNHPPAGSPR